jgi:hypothetical protein
MAGHAAARRENAARRMHAVNVFRAGFGTHQDHIAIVGGQLLGLLRGEGDFAGGGAGRCAQAHRDLIARRVGVQRGMQQLVQRFGLDPGDGDLAVDQPFALHVHGGLERSFRGALARAGLQHEQLAFLHREFHVLHVAIMLFQLLADDA